MRLWLKEQDMEQHIPEGWEASNLPAVGNGGALVGLMQWGEDQWGR